GAGPVRRAASVPRVAERDTADHGGEQRLEQLDVTAGLFQVVTPREQAAAADEQAELRRLACVGDVGEQLPRGRGAVRGVVDDRHPVAVRLSGTGELTEQVVA